MQHTLIRHSFRPGLFGLILLLVLSLGGNVAVAQPVYTGVAGAQQPRAQAAALPVPGGLTVRMDDRVATLQWNLDPTKIPSILPANVAGYRITWGPTSQPDANARLSVYNIIQLQPIENGKPYVVIVQSVDSMGNLSAPSAPLQFTGDPTRVDALRSRMNGFFDDFNLAPGAPDELKWNTAYSQCNAASSNGFFINPQSHGHNAIASANCDRGQQINRARVPLDLSDNGTRTITFDFDGMFRRNHWYLDLVPTLVDIAGPEKYPPGTLRFTQANQGVKISTFDASGTEVVLKETDWTSFQPLDALGVMQIPNVRRNWQLKVRKDSAEIRIDGKLVLATDPGKLQLSDNRYQVLWTTFGYNTNKANQPLALSHWDNFGFDAPPGASAATETHNYKLVNSGSDFVEARRSAGMKPTVELAIPDDVGGSTAQRLMFTLQMKDYSSYEWTPNDRVIVNGQPIAMPRPTSDTTPARTDLVDIIRPYTVVLPMPAGVLKQGKNAITFDLANSGVLNIHAEFDFPAASTAAYTPPSQTALNSPLPNLPNVGPNAVITQIGGTKVEYTNSELNDPATFNPGVSGVVPIAVQARGDTALEATGTNSGVVLVELLVDKRVILSQPTNAQSPAPSVNYTFNLDTRQFANGTHELYIRAYDPRCTPSIADYGGAGSVSGNYFPLSFTTKNANARAEAALAPAAAPAAGQYSVNVPMAMVSTVAACANATKVTNGLSAADALLPGGDTQQPEAIMRRKDEPVLSSLAAQFFICN